MIGSHFAEHLTFSTKSIIDITFELDIILGQMVSFSLCNHEMRNPLSWVFCEYNKFHVL